MKKRRKCGLTFILNSVLIPNHKMSLSTTIRYWFPDTLQCKYMSFQTYEQAVKCIELFKQIEVKAEVKI